jgi:hypothetical protein
MLKLLIIKFSQSVVKNRVILRRFLNKDCTFKSVTTESNLGLGTGRKLINTKSQCKAFQSVMALKGVTVN